MRERIFTTIVFVLIAILSMWSSLSFAADETCVSGNKTGAASGLIFKGGGFLRAIQITPDANDVIITLYDSNSAASGLVIGYWSAAGSATPETSGRPFSDVYFKHGIYYSITQNGATFSVDYRKASGRCDY